MAYLDNTGLGTLWGRIKAYIASLGYTSNVGTVTGVKMNNGSAISPVNGVVDLGTIVTSAPVTSVNGQTGAVSLSIPTVPTNVSAFTNDAGYTTNTGTVTSTGGTVSVNNIQVVSSLPASPDANTLYLIPES